MKNLTKDAIVLIIASAIVVFVPFFIGIQVGTKAGEYACNQEPTPIYNVIQGSGQEMEFGAIHYNDGTIGSINTGTASATLIIERNPGRQNLVITNTGSEAIYLWRKNYDDVSSANAEVSREGGIYLGASGGTYETWDSEFLWSGDVWASTSSASVTLTFDEK